jgi:adenine-specific DNA-methyltransferase
MLLCYPVSTMRGDHMALWTGRRSLFEQVELLRLEAGGRLDPKRRAELGQFFTPAPIARLMSAMLPPPPAHVRLLDAGAGVGSLLAAGVETLATAPVPPRLIEVTAYEIDPALHEQLGRTLQLCRRFCAERDIEFRSALVPLDFVAHAVERLRSPLLHGDEAAYSHVLLNPPHRPTGGCFARLASRHRTSMQGSWPLRSSCLQIKAPL